jgi:hypothetical protein
MGRERGGTHVCLYPERSQAYDFQDLSYKPMLREGHNNRNFYE